MGRVFISYRREDSLPYAHALYDLLGERYGEDHVFMDVETMIEPGAYAEAIVRLVRSSDVMLVVIGNDWLVDAQGRRPLEDPGDYVRVEVAAALRSNMRVIPVLVGGAQVPKPEELPEPLRMLSWREPFTLSEEGMFADRIERLLRALDRILAVSGTAEHEAAERRAPPSAFPEAVPPPVPAEGPLTIRLRQAALAGVVPESAASRATPDIESWDAEAYAPNERARARRSPTLAPQLVRIAVPLALLGALAAALKWLFGVFLAPVEATEGADTVECTVFAPPAAAPGSAILVQAFVHLPEEAEIARAIALELDTDARRRAFRSLQSPVTRGSRLQFELRMPGLEVDDPVASIVWRGRTEAVQFGVGIPARAPAGTVIGTLEISLNSAPVGHVKFKLAIEHRAVEASSEPQGEQARRYTAAFISYAARDRDEVLRRVQMLASVGIKYFQDVLTLEPGDRWLKKIELGIDECDLFLLFWSNEAKRSEWVRREVEYALSRKAGDDLAPPEIRPVIVEGHPIIEPWEELADLHFNDRLLYFMRPTNAP